MKNVSPALWQRLESIIDYTLDLPSEKRTQFLIETGKHDEAIKTLLLELWYAGKQADKILDQQFIEAVAQAAEQLQSTEIRGPSIEKGSRLGDYVVGPKIGSGGMSTVYMAERADGHFQQRVALKIVKQSIDNEQILLRFLNERQILAQLQHADIAHLIDGGATPQGKPYIVMEYVQGTPITDYCNANKLTIKQRLALVIKVGRAVEYAHRNLVVHRDLKPSNILVTDEGQVKLLDFGIAKVLSPSPEIPEHGVTVAEQRILTPEYAAPEQFSGGNITTLTDVYSLGLLTYELLCGCLPFHFPDRRLNTMEQIVRAHQPSPPSQLFAPSRKASFSNYSDEPDIISFAEHRGSTKDKLYRELKGDLDTILIKTLRLEPERRYASASALIRDVERYLNNEPIEARPDTFFYRTKKFYARHKAAATGALVAFLALMFGLVGMTIQSQMISQERDTAQNEALKAELVAELMVNIFEANDPEFTQGDTLNAFEILKRGASRIEEELVEEPMVAGNMLTVLGRMYLSMGSPKEAEQSLIKALDYHEKVPTTLTNPDRIETVLHYSIALYELGLYEQADSVISAALAQHELYTTSEQKHGLANLYNQQGQITMFTKSAVEAEPLHRQAIDLQLTIRDTSDIELAPYYLQLGNSLMIQSEFEEAESTFLRALSLYRANPQGNIKETINTLRHISTNFRLMGKYEHAETHLQEGMELAKKLYGTASMSYAIFLSEFAQLMDDRGDYDQAVSYNLEAISFFRDFFGNFHPWTVNGLNNLGVVYLKMGELKKGEPILREALAGDAIAYGEDSYAYSFSLATLGALLGIKGNYNEAEDLYRKALALNIKHIGERHITEADKLTPIAIMLYHKGQYEEAESTIRNALSIQEERLEGAHHLQSEQS